MKITYELINSLPEMINEKKITIEKSIDILWEHMFYQPYIYGLDDLSKDEISELLINFSKKFKRVFEEYDKQKNTIFVTYVTAIMKYEKLNYLKIKIKARSSETSSQAKLKIDYEESCDSYSVFEPENCIEELNELVFPDDNIDEKLLHKKRIAKYTALLLLLKSCQNVDDRHIKAVSKYLGINEDELFEKVEKLRESSFQNLETRKDASEKTQASFFLQQKYISELSKHPKDSIAYEKIKNKIDKKTKMWQNSIYRLNHKRSPSPSNRQIAEILEIPTRTVTRYLSNAKKNKGLLFCSTVEKEENVIN